MVHRRSLLVVGGQQEKDIANVLTCPIDDAGDVAGCTETTPLPETRSRHRALLHEGRVYVVGGRGDDGGRATFVGEVNDEGGIAGWRATTSLPSAAVFAAASLL